MWKLHNNYNIISEDTDGTSHGYTESKVDLGLFHFLMGHFVVGRVFAQAHNYDITVNFAYNDTRRGIRKCPHSRSVVIPEVSI